MEGISGGSSAEAQLLQSKWNSARNFRINYRKSAPTFQKGVTTPSCGRSYFLPAIYKLLRKGQEGHIHWAVGSTIKTLVCAALNSIEFIN